MVQGKISIGLGNNFGGNGFEGKGINKNVNINTNDNNSCSHLTFEMIIIRICRMTGSVGYCNTLILTCKIRELMANRN